MGYRQEGRQGAPGAAAAVVGERKGLQIGRGSVDVPAVALRPDVRHRRVARSGHMPPRGAFFLRFTFCASFFLSTLRIAIEYTGRRNGACFETRAIGSGPSIVLQKS